MTDTSILSGSTGTFTNFLKGVPGAMMSNMDEMKKTAQKEEKAAADTVTDIKDTTDKAEKKADETGALTPPTIQPFVPPTPTNPLQAFGSAAGILAAFGGLLTKRPLTTSLNAAASVMNAYKQNDIAAAQSA